MEDLPKYNSNMRTSTDGNFISRMHVEYNELQERRARLQRFIASDRFRDLDNVDQYLLLHQYTSMGDYMSILKMRIDRAEAEHPELTRF